MQSHKNSKCGKCSKMWGKNTDKENRNKNMRDTNKWTKLVDMSTAVHNSLFHLCLYARRESIQHRDPCRVSLALPEAPVQDLLVWGAGAEEGGRGTADVLRLVRAR